MAGYSGTLLVRKLGIKPGYRCRTVGEPDHYFELLGDLPDNVTFTQRTTGQFDFIHLFAQRGTQLEKRFDPLKSALKQDGCLWISWPKKASGVDTDLTGDIVRAFGLKGGLVDIKVCAVDDTWSGLKFVYRVKDRKKS